MASSAVGGAEAASDAEFFANSAKVVGGAVRHVQDYPKPGVVFKDYTSLLLQPDIFQLAIDTFARRYRDKGITHIASCETRGLVLGAPLALAMKCAFVPIRKPRKLPCDTVGVDYGRHFTVSRLEAHSDAIPKGARVLIVDDVIASAATMKAAATLIENCGGVVVECAVLVEMPELGGRAALEGRPLFVMAPDDAAEAPKAESAAAEASAAATAASTTA